MQLCMSMTIPDEERKCLQNGFMFFCRGYVRLLFCRSLIALLTGQAPYCLLTRVLHIRSKTMDLPMEQLVLHGGAEGGSENSCAKCYEGPPARMATPTKCFVCHSTHMLAFGELTWAVTCQHYRPFVVALSGLLRQLLQEYKASHASPYKLGGSACPTLQL